MRVERWHGARACDGKARACDQQRAPGKPIPCVVGLVHGAASAPVGSSPRRPHRAALKELQMSAQKRTDSTNRTAARGQIRSNAHVRESLKTPNDSFQSPLWIWVTQTPWISNVSQIPQVKVPISAARSH